jgi:uncharacterized protein (DUF433 family)
MATGPTFKEFAQAWTSGELARRHHDHVKAKASARDDEKRLARYAYPVVGNVSLAEFRGSKGLELIERISQRMSEVNPNLTPATRRQVLGAAKRVPLAVYTGRILATRHPHGSTDSAICHGKPIIKGTRVLVSVVLSHLAHGDSVEAIRKEFPSLTDEAVRAVIAFAAESAVDDLPAPAPRSAAGAGR